MPGNLAWTREEIILAMELYIQSGGLLGGPIPDDNSDLVRHLSVLLNRPGAYPPEVRGDRYRNPNGVALKLQNLRAVETNRERGMPAHSQLDAAVWRDYIDDLARLHREAQAIRTRVEEGAIQPASTVTTVEDVDIEQQHTEAYMVTPTGQPREADRAEQRLVLSYRDYMATKGILARRKRYRPAGEVRPLFSDIWVESRRALIEAKNSDDRNAVRQAIGQLYDYRRFHEPPIHIAVLFPYKPSPDRLHLLQSADVQALWPHGNKFLDSARGRFV